MTLPQIILTVLLLVMLGLLVWGRWRQDLVALLTLVAGAVSGLIVPDDVWLGLSHPAVVSVAAVLALSHGLALAGVVDWAARPLERIAKRPLLLLAGMTAMVAVLSAFINNVGALALLMPVAIRLARISGRPVSLFLMPLAFASLLGGMTTLIGTPPNLIVAGFRQQSGGTSFSMFDFSFVGIPVAGVGVLFLGVVGWRLIPQRKSAVGSDELVKIGPYLTEARVPANTALEGASVGEAVPEDVQLLSVVRAERRFASPSAFLSIRADDVLVLMGASEAIEKLTREKGLEIVKPGAPEEETDVSTKRGVKANKEDAPQNPAESKEVGLSEAVVKPAAWIVGHSAASLRLRERFGVNLLGLAREGTRREPRLAATRFRAGDVLLLQGAREDLPASISELGCLPLAERALSLGESSKRWRALAIFAVAVALVATGALPAPVALVAAAMAMVCVKVMSMRQVYEAIDFPVLALLAAMIPLGLAIETTGLADHISNGTIWAATVVPPWAIVAIVLCATMLLSDVVSNASAAVMMCPIAIGIAKGLNASADPFLIAVAIGASCAFLTPIGHQSNLLVMGPGGYRFADYWKCGIVLEAIIVLVSVPAIMLFWPPF